MKFTEFNFKDYIQEASRTELRRGDRANEKLIPGGFIWPRLGWRVLNRSGKTHLLCCLGLPAIDEEVIQRVITAPSRISTHL